MSAGNRELERLIFSQHLPVTIEAWRAGLPGQVGGDATNGQGCVSQADSLSTLPTSRLYHLSI